MSPFDILNVPMDCSDQVVRNAYLEAVKRFPPSQNPVFFNRIAQAYKQISTQRQREQYVVAGEPILADGELIDQVVAFGICQRKRPQLLALQQGLKQAQKLIASGAQSHE